MAKSRLQLFVFVDVYWPFLILRRLSTHKTRPIDRFDDPWLKRKKMTHLESVSLSRLQQHEENV